MRSVTPVGQLPNSQGEILAKAWSTWHSVWEEFWRYRLVKVRRPAHHKCRMFKFEGLKNSEPRIRAVCGLFQFVDLALAVDLQRHRGGSNCHDSSAIDLVAYGHGLTVQDRRRACGVNDAIESEVGNLLRCDSGGRWDIGRSGGGRCRGRFRRRYRS